MSTPLITVFPKADTITVVKEGDLPDGSMVFLHTYKYRNKPVCYLRIWMRENEFGAKLILKTEYTDLTQ